jgi:hypothetical protein
MKPRYLLSTWHKSIGKILKMEVEVEAIWLKGNKRHGLEKIQALA